MSTVVPLAQLKPVLESAASAYLIFVAATALILYEHAITIDLEVQQVWRRNISGATVLFILTRYLTLLDRIFVVISLSPLHSLDSCNITTWLQAVTTSTLVVVMSAIAAVRVYALWNRDVGLFVVVMLSGLFPAFTNLYFRSASTVLLVPSNIYTCQSVPTAMSAQMYMNLSVATRVLSIFSDGMVVVLTWLKTYRVFVLSRGMVLRTNYSTLILRDGTLYFLAVCVLNVVAIIYVMNFGSNLLNDIIVTLSSLLMSRFLLNLRDERARNESQSVTLSRPTASSSRSFSTVNFASIASHSMGGSMTGDDDPDGVEDHNDAGLWRCETFGSTSTEATCVGSAWHSSKESLVSGGKTAV